MYQNLPMYEQSCNLWNGEKGAEAMWKQDFQIQKKWPDKLKFEILTP